MTTPTKPAKPRKIGPPPSAETGEQPAPRVTRREAREARKTVYREKARTVQAEEKALVEAAGMEIVRAGRGAPTTYTPEQGMDLCAWMSAGNSMTKWCRERGVAPQVVYQWLRRQPAFAELYERACEDRADTLADHLIEIADAPAPDGLTMEEVQLRKLRIDTRKWVAAKLMPKRWGDQREQQATGSVTISIGIPQPGQPITVFEADTGTAVQLSP